jgi:hypothetical protein
MLETRLELDKHGRAEVICWGDVHVGHPNCNWQKAKGYLDFALANHQYVLGMGDLIECVLPTSKGDIFGQKLDPQEQTQLIIEALEPLAKAGLLIGLLRGNHSWRVMQATSFDPIAIMCKQLKVRHLGDACYQMWRVGKQSYTAYTVHGRSNAKLPQTKLLACRKLAEIASADVYLHGHLHTLETSAAIYYDFNRTTKRKETKTRHFCITGSFLNYEGSYAETTCLIPARTGSPRVTFEAETHDLHISL